jgi:mono/diheme cytochrome c family protein
MIRRHATWFAIAGLIVVVVVGVVAFGDSPTDEDLRNGVPAQNPSLVAAGEPLYRANCASCHGSDLRGTSTGPSHLSIVYVPSHHGDVTFALAARNGVQSHHWGFGDMPPVPGLSDGDLAAITAYVRSVQRVEGFEPYPP